MNNEIVLRNATPNDLNAIVLEHCHSFSKNFSSCLGKHILFSYYETYYKVNPNLFFVAEIDGTICGFIMGYFCENNPYKLFEKENKKRIMLRVFCRLLLLDSRAWSRLFKKHKKTVIINEQLCEIEKKEKGDLLSICVSQQFRRRGVANLLIKRFCEELEKYDRHYCILSVNANNQNAISLYEKNEFVIYKQDDNLHYIKVLKL